MAVKVVFCVFWKCPETTLLHIATERTIEPSSLIVSSHLLWTIYMFINRQHWKRSFIDITSLIRTFSYSAISLAPRTPQMDAAPFRFVCFYSFVGICHVLSFTSITLSTATALFQSTGRKADWTEQTKPGLIASIWRVFLELALFLSIYLTICWMAVQRRWHHHVGCEIWELIKEEIKNRWFASNRLIDMNKPEHHRI